MKLAIIIPCFNESKNIHPCYQAIRDKVSSHKYEFVFVDDGSTDQTLLEIKKLAASDPNVSFISLSRNFGHQNALKAGYDYVSADCVLCLDADLQHPPRLIESLIRKWKEGYDVVYTIREDTIQIPLFKRITSNLFYKFINLISDVKIVGNSADFRLLDRKVVNAIKNLNENDPFLRGLISWAGFNQTGVTYQVEKRVHGNSKYSLRKMISLSLKGITSFSINPLRISSFIGFVFSVIAFLYGFYAIYLNIFTEKTVEGWTSLIASFLFITGLQFIMLGIIGEYIGKGFIQAKGRPAYLINDKKIRDLADMPASKSIQGHEG